LRVTVLFLGPAKDAVGIESDHMELSDGSRLGELKEKIVARHPSYAHALESVRFAVNEEFADHGRPLRDGDVVAIVPPVSGG